MLQGRAQPFLEVQPLLVKLGGAVAGVAVSLGDAQLFFTDRPELGTLDGRRFASLAAVEREASALLSPRRLAWRERQPQSGATAALRPSGRRASIRPNAHQVLLCALQRVWRGAAGAAPAPRGLAGSGATQVWRPKAAPARRRGPAPDAPRTEAAPA